MDNFYKIGEKYWASNPKAGRNMQSSGTLIGWDEYNKETDAYDSIDEPRELKHYAGFALG